MVLTPESLGIRKGLAPVFCGICGNRVCWANDDYDLNDALLECEECSKEVQEDE